MASFSLGTCLLVLLTLTFLASFVTMDGGNSTESDETGTGDLSAELDDAEKTNDQIFKKSGKLAKKGKTVQERYKICYLRGKCSGKKKSRKNKADKNKQQNGTSTDNVQQPVDANNNAQQPLDNNNNDAQQPQYTNNNNAQQQQNTNNNGVQSTDNNNAQQQPQYTNNDNSQQPQYTNNDNNNG